MSELRKTRNNLPDDVKRRMAEILNKHVVDLTDLLIQTKVAHWNVRGPHFIAYHELFDELAGHLFELTDTLAERVTALGGIAGAPVQTIAAQTSLPGWALETTKDSSVMSALVDRWAVVANSAREAVVTTADEDPDTSDLFTEVSRQLDKDLWFLEAHLSE
jgi:starvation-inducible DNA-binding protein